MADWRKLFGLSKSAPPPSRAARVADLASEARKSPVMDRREFLKRTGGFLAAASTDGPAKLVSKVVGDALPPVSPYMDDLSGFGSVGVDSDGYFGPSHVFRAYLPVDWWDNPASRESRDAGQRLRRELFEATRAFPAAQKFYMPTGEGPDIAQVPMLWNEKTKQWHHVVYDRNQNKIAYLKQHASLPETASYPYGWEPPNFAGASDMGMDVYGQSPLEVSNALQQDYSLALRRQLREQGIDHKAMRENPDYAKEALKHMDNKGLATGPRPSMHADLSEPMAMVRHGVEDPTLSYPDTPVGQPTPMTSRAMRNMRAFSIPAAIGVLDGLRSEER